MDKEQLTGIVFLARKLHWTRDEIGKLSPEQFEAMLEETAFQEQQDEYKRSYEIASLMATIVNCAPRKDRHAYKAEDFIGKQPIRDKRTSLEMAKAKGLKIPKEDI